MNDKIRLGAATGATFRLEMKRILYESEKSAQVIFLYKNEVPFSILRLRRRA
jgi:hypothetical protein